ncbi:MAG: polysaccharide export protein [Rhizobiales bacterium]|jgi:polysaccharide export outer membrane protein|nr:polysaccharide export protein [Hyphomicrobiales bacterium]
MRLSRIIAFSLIAFVLGGCASSSYQSPGVIAPVAYADQSMTEPSGPYRLGSGDRLRIVVFGQEGLTSTYAVDPNGSVTMPLIGTVPARGLTTKELAQSVTARLKNGYIREPHVAVEVEFYRPFFILGEVANPGQYPYVANMTVETAVAIAGGFSPRAYKGRVRVSRTINGELMRGQVPLYAPVRPGDTINVAERWF